MILTRSRYSAAAPAESQKKMRRIWVRGDPYKGARNEQYWYIESFSRELGIAQLARAMRRKPDSFDGER